MNIIIEGYSFKHITFAWFILVESSLDAKPPNTKECIAPKLLGNSIYVVEEEKRVKKNHRVVASMATMACGIIGIWIKTLSPFLTPCLLKTPAK
jgi:hypothetical protein